jgi:hypothetical protein
MKPFNVYQYLEGEQMTDRDKLEIGSKFWNKGKWDNYVLPFLPDNPQNMTFVDMGCNKGLFLKLAEEMGFKDVVGVDSDSEAVDKGTVWKMTHNHQYRFLNIPMEKSISQLPVADYTLFANSHYYMTINDWLDHIDQLQYKTRYVIIVTAEKSHKNKCWVLSDVEAIRKYFETWEEVGFIDALPTADDPMPRKLWGLCFKSPFVQRIPIDSITSRNTMQQNFYGELDRGIKYIDTRYYRYISKYRVKWPESRRNRWFEERLVVYEDVKKNGLKKPILVDSGNVILEGNHRYFMLKNLGYKSILVRYT